MFSELIADAKAALVNVEAKLVQLEANVETDVNQGAANLIKDAQAAKAKLVALLEELEQKLN